jgi:hypothetical protein
MNAPMGIVKRNDIGSLIIMMADGTLDSQIGARICNGLGIMRACLETAKLERLDEPLSASEALQSPCPLYPRSFIWR